MQKKKCPVLQIIGLLAAAAAVMVVLPKVVSFVKGKFAKDDIDDMEFEFEDEDAKFVRPEPMEKETKSEEPDEIDEITEINEIEEIFEEE